MAELDKQERAELEQLRALVKQLNPAGHSLRDLLREDARRRDFIDRMQAESVQLRARAAADHEAARVAAGLPKSWVLSARCHFVALVQAADSEPVVVYRWWRRRHQVWEYGAKELWQLQYALGPKGRYVRV